MKLVFVLLAVSAITLVYADWESVGPDGGPIDFIVQSNVNPDVLYANSVAYTCRFVRSDDGGLTWTRAGDYDQYSYSMAIGPTDIIYSGGISTVYISTDGAETWNSAYLGSNVYMMDILCHPTDSAVVYATGKIYDSGTWNLYYFKSEDCGENWSMAELLSDASGSSIAFSESAPDTIYIGAMLGSFSGGLLYKSTDGGSSFADITPAEFSSEYETHSIAVHPDDPDILCVSNRYHMYRSADGGSTWTEVESSTVYDLVWSTANTDVVYGSSDTAVYYSTDGGNTWDYSSDPESGRYETMVASSAAGTDAWTGAEPGLYMTEDGGISWTAVTEGMNIGTVAALERAFSNPSRMYLSMEDVGVFLTDDSGENWTKLDTLLDCGDICAFAVSSTDPDYVYALEGAG